MEESIVQSADFTALVREQLELPDVKANEYSPLALAYMGDAVYELIIRTKILSQGSMQVNKMHKRSSGLVRAGTQAALIKALEEQLTDEEHSIYKRGRNAKSVTTAKHATMIDYRMATGFEALVGYLYLTNQHNRLLSLIRDGLAAIGELGN